MKIFRFLLIFLLVFPLSCGKADKKLNLSSEDVIVGKVIHIVDGDTYDVLTKSNEKVRIRMEGIDAPERGMAFYRVSKDYLGELCMNKTIKVKQTDTDRYGRVLGFGYLPDGSELGSEMIKAGMAWHYKQYNSDDDLAKLEIEARKARRGLWHDANPVAPWEHRKIKRQQSQKK